MSEPLYDIYFKGESLEGFNNTQVQQNVGLLFKASPEKIQQLFSGKVVALKKGLDKNTVLKFQAALKKAGAKIYIKQAQAAVQQSTPTTETTARPAAIDILPVGSDVLTEAERSHIEVPDIDTSNIHMTSAFAVPVDDKPAPPPAPDTSHISAAKEGTDLREGQVKAAVPAAPDTTHIILGEVGEDLLPAHEEIPLPEPDTSHIDLAEVGADIDPVTKKAPPPAPDTSHIQLSP